MKEHYLEKNKIYQVIVGSTAYGLNTPKSDVDMKGIFIPNKENYFGLDTCDQIDISTDSSLYSIKKFIKLAAQANPNIIEMLYVDDKFIRHINEYGKLIRDNRHIFLSSKAKFKFSDYAFAQLTRIKGHKKWLMYDEAKPIEEDYFVDKVRRTSTGLIPYKKFMEHEYKDALKKYNQYLTWQKQRNPDRAKLEEKYGYDCKHAMHLIRLLRMGKEILQKGEVNVLRKDREELLAIRQGKWEYDKLIEVAENSMAELDDLYEKSTLPKKPQYKSINNLLIDVTERYFNDIDQTRKNSNSKIDLSI